MRTHRSSTWNTLLRRTAHQFQGPATHLLGPLSICRHRLHRPRLPSLGNRPSNRARTNRAPSRSCISAGCTTTVSSSPRVSTTMSCAHSPVCQRRSPWAPFFRGLDRLAVDDRGAGTGLATLGLSQCYAGRRGPVAIRATPGAEVMEDDAPRQVVGSAFAKSSRCAEHSGWR